MGPQQFAETVPNGRGPVGERHGWNVWENVTCVECPGCGFTFDQDHEDLEGGYSCSLCAPPGSVPVAHLQAMVRLLFPEEMTPVAKRRFEQLIAQYDGTSGA